GAATRPRTATAARNIARSERPAEVIGERVAPPDGRCKRSGGKPTGLMRERRTPGRTSALSLKDADGARTGRRRQLLSRGSLAAARDRRPPARERGLRNAAEGAHRSARRLRVLRPGRGLGVPARRGRPCLPGGAAGSFALRAPARARAPWRRRHAHSAGRRSDRGGLTAAGSARPRRGALARGGAAFPPGRAALVHAR